MKTEFVPPDRSRTATGVLLIVVPALFSLLFTLLAQQFEYPGILRKDSGFVLAAFHRGGSGLQLLWYGMMTAALLFVPLAVGVRCWLQQGTLALVFGVLAGLVQALGLARWVFLVPFLAGQYTDPGASPAAKDAVLIVFGAFHQFFGAGIGEHLGYLFTGLWTLLTAQSLLRTGHPWLGRIGIALSLGILGGLLETAGASWAAQTTSLSYLLWSVWMIALGITCLRTQRRSLSNPAH
jgi:hypothetical protein